MTINKISNGNQLTLEIEGRLDTTTAGELEAAIKGSLNGVKLLILDFVKLIYVSSAGLRVILGAQKSMSKQGEMKVINVNETIMEVFDITGFSDILTIE